MDLSTNKEVNCSEINKYEFCVELKADSEQKHRLCSNYLSTPPPSPLPAPLPVYLIPLPPPLDPSKIPLPPPLNPSKIPLPPTSSNSRQLSRSRPSPSLSRKIKRRIAKPIADVYNNEIWIQNGWTAPWIRKSTRPMPLRMHASKSDNNCLDSNKGLSTSSNVSSLQNNVRSGTRMTC